MASAGASLAVFVVEMLFCPVTAGIEAGSVDQISIPLIFFEKSLKFSMQGALLKLQEAACPPE
jgi:hypothetical protein